MTKLVKIEVPFEGFYETFLGAAVEDEIGDQFSIWGLSFDSVGSVDVDRDSIAKNWLELYSKQISEALDIDDVMLSFAELVSHSEYNFQNDRIIANITEDKLAILSDAMQKLYSLEYLQDKADSLFLSRDGFINFNSGLAKPENWDTLENQFIGLLWLPSASEFEEVMGYDLNQYIAEELYMQGSISNNVHFPEMGQGSIVEFDQLAGELQEQLREDGYSDGDVLFWWGRQILNYSQADMRENGGYEDFHYSISFISGKVLLVKLIDECYEKQVVFREV